jgi:excisionase family DNA binding protein
MKLYTPNEVAEMLRVDVSTVNKWHKRGEIKGIKLGSYKNSPLRIPESEVRRISEGYVGQQ